MAGPTTGPGAASNGLIKAIHGECDFGDQILLYLATGDNRGNPKMDTAFSPYVGVPLPQARSVADQKIQECDANLSKQETAKASAEASAKAKDSQATALAEASALATHDKATRLASEQKTCAAALGGRVRDGGNFADLCVSNIQGSTTDGSRTSCNYAQIAFQPDGTLTTSDIASIKSGYPGCFP
jgi:hypothetical protein